MGLMGVEGAKAYSLELLDFHAWRARQLQDLLLANDSSLWTRSLSGSFGSLNEIVNHLVWAEEVWFERSQGRPMPPRAPRSTTELLQRWPVSISKWMEMVQNSSETEVHRSTSFQDSKGMPYTFSLLEILVHLVDHATYHVGQAMDAFRSFGVAPPSTNYIHYLRAKL